MPTHWQPPYEAPRLGALEAGDKKKRTIVAVVVAFAVGLACLIVQIKVLKHSFLTAIFGPYALVGVTGNNEGVRSFLCSLVVYFVAGLTVGVIAFRVAQRRSKAHHSSTYE